MTIGERIRMLRKEKGYTQSELASRCGYSSFSNINKIELGINNVPISVVENISKVFGVSPAYLMGWEERALKTPLNTFKEKSKEEEPYILQLFNLLTSSRQAMLTGIAEELVSASGVSIAEKTSIKKLSIEKDR